MDGVLFSYRLVLIKGEKPQRIVPCTTMENIPLKSRCSFVKISLTQIY